MYWLFYAMFDVWVFYKYHSYDQCSCGFMSPKYITEHETCVWQ